MKRKRLNSDDISPNYQKSKYKKLNSDTVNIKVKGKTTNGQNNHSIDEGRKTRSGRVHATKTQAKKPKILADDKQTREEVALSNSNKKPSKTNKEKNSPRLEKSKNAATPNKQSKHDLENVRGTGKNRGNGKVTSSRSRKLISAKLKENWVQDDYLNDENALVPIKKDTTLLQKPKLNDESLDNSNKTSDDSEESEWEDVPELREEPIIPEGGVQFTIELQQGKKKSSLSNKERYLQYHVGQRIRKYMKRSQQNLHKAQLLCYVAHGMFANKIIQSDEIKAVYLSLNFPPIFSKNPKNITKDNLQGIVNKFGEKYTLSSPLNVEKSLNLDILMNVLSCQTCDTIEELAIIFVAILRIAGLKVRLIYSVQPDPVKLKIPKKKSKKNKAEPNKESENKEVEQPKKSKNSDELQPVKQDLEVAERKRKKKSEESDDEEYEEMSSDEDFEVKASKRKKVSKSKKDKQQTPEKVNSSNSEKIDIWVEVYSTKYKKWLCVDVVNGTVIDSELMEEFVTEPMHYVLGFEDDGSFKDLTAYYAKNFMVQATKLRVDPEWWAAVLNAFACEDPAKQAQEEIELCNFQMEKPLPASIYEYKNHPLYVLRRHLLKFEVIYPPDTEPVGFVKKEPVYPRGSVHMLRTTGMWMKEACQIKPNEEPYKIVKARPTWNKELKKIETGLLDGAYGKWQIEPYRPPVAVNGKVPRNERGYVDLYKPSMLPIGTVHILDMPEINKTAYRLGIDCAQAFKGWELNGLLPPTGPIYHGWVVCAEHYETLKSEYVKWEAYKKKREQEKRENRVYGNWKKLIRGAIIRDRLKAKYSK